MTPGLRAVLAVLATALLSACSSGGATPAAGPLSCAAGEEAWQGACIDPVDRYQPAQPLDQDNVVAYGSALTELVLPPPPKSGFRIIAPPRTLMPGEEQEFCLSWPYPKGLHNKVIYAGRLYTTPGLHHSNLIAKPVNKATGPNPYPACNPGASDPFGQLPQVIPDVLFANSTQVKGGETLAFPPGMGFRVDTTREIATDMHLLNTVDQPQRVEVAYDFYTMPDDDLVNEVAPWTLQVDQFLIPPHATMTIGSTCDTFGGNVVEMMPHTHKLRQQFTVDFLDFKGTATNILTDGRIDSGLSEIVVYDPALPLAEVGKIRYACTFDNITNRDVVYGLGQNEMCILFGYVYPVANQFVGHSATPDAPCDAVQIGLFR